MSPQVLLRRRLLPLVSTLLLLLVGAAGGCARVTLEDDVDLVLDFTPLVGPSNALNSPYIEGSSMRIYVHSTNNKEDFSGWRVTSSAPDVFAVDSVVRDTSSTQDALVYCLGHALRPGDAQLQVLDENGQIVGGDLVQVRRPDEIQLLAHGLLLVGRNGSEARVTDLRVVADGTATYLARYFAGGIELHGNGALSVSGGVIQGQPGGVAQVARSFIFEDRDWLQVSPQMVGSGTVALDVNGTPFGSVPVVSVPGTDVTSIRILGQDESSHKQDDWMVAFAQAADGAGRAIYGVEYKWSLDQTAQTGLGDLYRYHYKPQLPKMLSASFGSMAAQAMIHADKGYVDSTNRVGCQAAPTSGRHRSTTAPLALALLVGIALLRSRRRPRLG